MVSSYKDDDIIIAGDFNADTVNPNHKRSLRFLRNFLNDTDFISITEELASPGAFTYRSDDGVKMSCIDGFLLPKTALYQVTNLSIGPDTPENISDHQLVCIQWNSITQDKTSPKQDAYSSTHRIQNLRRLKIKWSLVSKEEIKTQYTTPLEKVAEQLFKSINESELDSDSVDDMLQSLSVSMIETSLNLPHSFPSTRKQGKREWNHTTMEKYKASLQAWKAWKREDKPSHGPLYNQYLQSKKDFRRQIRQSRAQIHRNLLQNIENASENDQRLFHQLIKAQRPTNASGLSTDTLKYDGKVYQGDMDIIAGWHCYFKDLCQPLPDDDTTPPLDIPQVPATPQFMCTPTITSRELEQAIANLNKGKASGPDNVSPEHLIYIGKTTLHLILLIFNYYLTSQHTSKNLKKGLILPFHKGKGKDTQDPKNYRGITLTSTFAKLLELVLKPSMDKSLKADCIPDEQQFGFQKNHSCIMTSCTLELIIESNTCQKRTTYVALLDAEKAFDKVWHDGLFNKLEKTNIDPAHNALLRSFYSDLESQVFWDGKTSESIPILQGVRQGGVLSPLLYNVFIDGLIKLLKEKNLGCHHLNQYTGVIVLADDVALVSTSPG